MCVNTSTTNIPFELTWIDNKIDMNCRKIKNSPPASKLRHSRPNFLQFWVILGAKKIRVICVLAKYLLPLHRILRHNLWQASTYISLFANRGAATATSSRLLNSRGERIMHMPLSLNSTTVGTYSPNPSTPSTSAEAHLAKCPWRVWGWSWRRLLTTTQGRVIITTT